MAPVTASLPASAATVTVAAYLDREAAADKAGGRKAEFVDGEIREMPGASWRHNAVVGNLFVAIGMRLRGKSFAACGSEMRVRVASPGPFYYPDLCVSPIPPAIVTDRGESLVNPTLITEVLSPTTEAVDRGEKLAGYTRIPTLRHYLLVDPNACRVDHYSLDEDGSWRLVILDVPSATLSLSSIGVELPLVEIYDRVLPAQPGT
ncbi:MAG: Uma2 family endonuclease [Planctomycetaceae bacterium]